MSRPLWLVALVKAAFPQRFLAAKATRLPLLGRLLERWLFEGDDILYLPRDEVVLLGEAVDTAEEIVLPSQVVDRFIEAASHHWIMNFCICRAGEKCQDYPIELGCLFLGEAVLGIHPRLGRLVTKEEAHEHVRRCREAGLVHLIGRNKLDTVWLGIGPGRKLLTICHCCPCCCLWRVLPHIAPQIGAKIRRMPGVRVTVTEACIGCGACAQGVCFAEAIRLEDGKAVIGEACRGCGRCIRVCPQTAIRLTIEDDAFVERAIERVASLVDIG